MIQFLRVCQPLDEPTIWREYVAKGDDQERAKLLRVRRDLIAQDDAADRDGACRPSCSRRHCAGTSVPSSPPQLPLTLLRCSTKDMLDSAGKPLISLPEVLYYKHEVELKQEIRDLYKEVEDEVGKNVKKTFEEGSSKASYTHIRAPMLVMLCRPKLS